MSRKLVKLGVLRVVRMRLMGESELWCECDWRNMSYMLTSFVRLRLPPHNACRIPLKT